MSSSWSGYALFIFTIDFFYILAVLDFQTGNVTAGIKNKTKQTKKYQKNKTYHWPLAS